MYVKLMEIRWKRNRTCFRVSVETHWCIMMMQMNLATLPLSAVNQSHCLAASLQSRPTTATRWTEFNRHISDSFQQASWSTVESKKVLHRSVSPTVMDKLGEMGQHNVGLIVTYSENAASTVQKRLNRSICRLGWWGGPKKRIVY